MSTLVSNTDFTDIAVFANEVKNAFKTAIPPICISFDTRESIEQYIQPFLGEKGYVGKRVSCKHAKIGSFGNFSVNEIFGFKEEHYPIQLSFKQLAEFEDFAKGWSRAIEKANTPKAEPAPAPSTPIIKEQQGTSKDKPEVETSVRFRSFTDIYTFAQEVKKEFSLEGISVNPKEVEFECNFPSAGKLRNIYPFLHIINNTPNTIYFKNANEMRTFASAFETFITEPTNQSLIENLKKDADKQDKTPTDTQEYIAKQMQADSSSTQQYPVNPLAEKILDNILKTNLTFSWIIGIFVIIASLIGGSYMIEDGLLEGVGYIFLLFGTVIGVIIILLGYYRWALGKVQINISRNLFNINSKLKTK